MMNSKNNDFHLTDDTKCMEMILHQREELRF